MISETGCLLILNKESGAVEGWCDDCDDLVMLQPEEAAAIAGFRLAAIYESFEFSGWRIASGSRLDSRAYLDGLLRPA